MFKINPIKTDSDEQTVEQCSPSKKGGFGFKLDLHAVKKTDNLHLQKTVSIRIDQQASARGIDKKGTKLHPHSRKLTEQALTLSDTQSIFSSPRKSIGRNDS